MTPEWREGAYNPRGQSSKLALRLERHLRGRKTFHPVSITHSVQRQDTRSAVTWFAARRERESHPYARYEIVIHTLNTKYESSMKYLLRGIDEVYNKGTDADGKDKHHLKYNKNNERNG